MKYIFQKGMTFVLTLFLSGIAYWFLLPESGREGFGVVWIVLGTGITFGTVFSFLIDRILRNVRKHHLTYKLLLHIAAGILLLMVFVKVEEWLFSFFWLILPVVILFVFIDEILRRNTFRTFA
ncbi:hypothetical protein EQV77_06320 [Halobacillus fulvus]|nr:hypothetical protein EQV77_06320 [Halobacillus fulvus]